MRGLEQSGVVAAALVMAVGTTTQFAAAQPDVIVPSGPTAPDPTADEGEAGEDTATAQQQEDKLIWRNSVLTWTQSATGQTVGFGQDFQSANPAYEWTFALKPRLSLFENDTHSLSLRANVGAFREFTDSDATARRGEWSLTDAVLLGAYSLKIHASDGYQTAVSLQAPVLTFPSSRMSANNGSILRLGGKAELGQQVPVLGQDASALQVATGGVSVGYTRHFTEATVAIGRDLQRTRLDPEGRAIPGDQLTGAPLARDSLSFGVKAGLAITERISLGTGFNWLIAYKHPVVDTEVCNVVQPGCVAPRGIEDPQNDSVVTLFAVELGIQVLDELSLAFGYTNLTLQLGPDGQRRNILYSPDARLFLTAATHLDALYNTVAGRDGGDRETANRARSARW